MLYDHITIRGIGCTKPASIGTQDLYLRQSLTDERVDNCRDKELRRWLVAMLLEEVCEESLRCLLYTSRCV